MSLNWNLSAIKDFHTVCWYAVEGEKSQLKPVTNTLIWSTLTVGMPEITQSNWKEFFMRLRFWENLFCPFLDDHQFITQNQVVSHIGLKTNAQTETRNQFLKRATTHFFRE